MFNLAIEIWTTSLGKLDKRGSYCWRCDFKIDRDLFCVLDVMINLALKVSFSFEKIEEITVRGVMLT